MGKDDIIREMVEKFTNDEKLFTSVDVGNAIKTETKSMDVRNRDVTAWLHANAQDPLLQHYNTTKIPVNGGQNQATLYYPHWKDPEDYTDRDQTALYVPGTPAPAPAPTPAPAVTNAQATPAAPVTPAAPTQSPTPASRHSDSYVDLNDLFDDGGKPNSTIKMKKQINSIERIKISGDIVRELGWKPGDMVDVSKIKIHTGTLNPKLRVNSDYRVSIPRRLVGYGTDPIKVLLKDGYVYFEKA